MAPLSALPTGRFSGGSPPRDRRRCQRLLLRLTFLPSFSLHSFLRVLNSGRSGMSIDPQLFGRILSISPLPILPLPSTGGGPGRGGRRVFLRFSGFPLLEKIP